MPHHSPIYKLVETKMNSIWIPSVVINAEVVFKSIILLSFILELSRKAKRKLVGPSRAKANMSVSGKVKSYSLVILII